MKTEYKPVGRLISVLTAVLVVLFLVVLEIFSLRTVWDTTAQLTFSEKIPVGQSISVSDLVSLSDIRLSQLEWEVSGSDTIALEEDAVTALRSGDALLIGRDLQGRTVSCRIEAQALWEITLSMQQCTLGVGQSAQLEAYSDNGDALSFSSSDEQVATVSEDGAITAVSVGSAQVYVNAPGCDAVSCQVEVLNVPAAIGISRKSIKLGKGESYTLAVSVGQGEYEGEVQFESGNPNVATVSADGTIKAVSAGSAVITASAYGGASAKCTVEVCPLPKSLEISVGKDGVIYAGKAAGITKKLSDGAACTSYTYESSNPSVAYVNENGQVVGKSRGTATIKCVCPNGVSSSCTVTVRLVDYMTPYTSDAVYDDLGYLAAQYPDLIKLDVIGTSVYGKEIPLLTMGTGKRKALVVAGIHAREDITVSFTMRCVEEYAAAYYSSSGKFGSYNMRKLLSEWTLYIVPMCNPDGTDIVNGGVEPAYLPQSLDSSNRAKYKANANGVNLNRNFPFRWDKTVEGPDSPDGRDYKGPYEASEPETQAIVDLCQAHDFEWMFSMHVKGNFIYWQDAYTEPKKADYILSNRLETYCELGLKSKSPLYNLGGGLENWFRAEYGRPGFCIELVPPEYSVVVNYAFDIKTRWSKTKYIFIQGMR